MIKLDNISISFGNKKIVGDLSINVGKNEFVGIVGSNGSGKSTLAFFLAGVIPELVDADIKGRYSIEGDVGLILQNPGAQFVSMTVREEAGENKLLGSLVHKNVFELSEGEKQKVNLIANISNNKNILILDEPLELLDPYEAKRFLELINSIENKTIIWFDKDERFMSNCDRIIRLDKKNKIKNIKKLGNKTEKIIFELDKSIEYNNTKLRIKDFQVKNNEKIAIIGKNGSGKTSFLKYLALNSGLKLSYAAQNPTHMLFEEKVKHEIKDKKNIGLLQIKHLLEQDPNKLSKGQQKLVSIASTNGNLLLLDEPTTWLDKNNKYLVYDFVNNRNTIIMATHDQTLLDYCDTVYMIDKGELKRCSSTMIRQFFAA